MPDIVVEVPIALDTGEKIKLLLYPERENTYFCITEREVEEFGEVPHQICEGCAYEYKLSDDRYQLEEINEISKRSRCDSHGGRITPGNYTGRLKFRIIEEKTGKTHGLTELEVRSTKAEYRSDYRIMLEEITEKCTELLMEFNSPVTQSFETSFNMDSRAHYQQFAFIKSILLANEFQEAVHKIINSPVVKWDEEYQISDIRKARHFDRSLLKQIASTSVRINTPDGHPIKGRLASLPEKVDIRNKKESMDTQENRFIKHALTTFLFFVSTVRTKFTKGTREEIEAGFCENILEDTLGHSIFKQISRPELLGLNSPVLQKKEGYREICRAWLMFELASKLVWKGGDDVYEAGKRDVATLYEYWLFFRLLDLFSDIFLIEPKPADELIEKTENGLGLKLKSGKHIPLKGICHVSGRKLNIQFSYNRTFCGDTSYPNSGSWSVTMRPDYTLSIWPFDFTMEEAEEQEIIVHIHFDAKYKVERLQEIFGKNSNQSDGELNAEALEQKKGIYKKADVLKMHAYKDAIRRTVGAYILYPGSEKRQLKGFHELIPGLGAFAVRPSKSDTGINELRKFVDDIFQQYLSRSSQHERMSYYNYDVHTERDSTFVLREATPEKRDKIREKPPSDIWVLIGYYQEKQKEWIRTEKLYNIRFEEKISPQMSGARYVLLYDNNEKETNDIWEVIGTGPRIWSAEELAKRGYKDPKKSEYFVYEIEKVSAKEFHDTYWDVSRLADFKHGRPFSVSLLDLMKVKKRHN